MARIIPARGALIMRRMVNGWAWRALGVAAVLTMASQVLPTTRLVYAPGDVTIEGDTIRHFRGFPGDMLGLPRPRLSYVETVRPLTPGHNAGQACENDGGPFRYDSRAPVGEWRIPWAAPCLSDPAGFTWRAEWTWHVGAMTFGPVSKSQRILKGGGE